VLDVAVGDENSQIWIFQPHRSISWSLIMFLGILYRDVPTFLISWRIIILEQLRLGLLPSIQYTKHLKLTKVETRIFTILDLKVLKRLCHEIFDPGFFSSNMIPWYML
jgi:hypothetical protein